MVPPVSLDCLYVEADSIFLSLPFDSLGGPVLEVMIIHFLGDLFSHAMKIASMSRNVILLPTRMSHALHTGDSALPMREATVLLIEIAPL